MAVAFMVSKFAGVFKVGTYTVGSPLFKHLCTSFFLEINKAHLFIDTFTKLHLSTLMEHTLSVCNVSKYHIKVCTLSLTINQKPAFMMSRQYWLQCSIIVFRDPKPFYNVLF